jgi:GNAT superfamily N-acetyltransferase
LAGVVDADALPGQPACRVGALLGATGLRPTGSDLRAGAALGQAGTVRDWQTLVAIGDEVLGAVCFGRSDGGRVGTIRWLHAREDPAVVADLLDQALARLSGCRAIEAFVAGGIDPLVAGLPDDRDATREALAEREFTGKQAGRFLYRALHAPPAAGDSCAVQVVAIGNERRLSIAGPAGDQVAKATISVPAPGHGVVDWIEVHPAHRGQGLGGRLLKACLRLMYHLGVRHVVGHLDDHNLDADDGHGRIGAHIVTSRAGFVTGAHLTTYRRTR